ncbi:MAG TPA: DoxX family protein [Puia sp.]|nr:DoxX family protein [Puia sp.]
MQKIKIAYWIVTAIFAAFMAMSGFFDAISTPDALKVFKDLELPAYLSPFLGVAKLLGAIAIIVPGFPRLKEWAYAGLFFDLLGATYCSIASGHPAAQATFMLLPLAFLFVSYGLYHRKARRAA